jgi:hypothetical protein
VHGRVVRVLGMMMRLHIREEAAKLAFGQSKAFKGTEAGKGVQRHRLIGGCSVGGEGDLIYFSNQSMIKTSPKNTTENHLN